MALKDLFRGKFQDRIAALFTSGKNKEEILGELEEQLLLSDIALPVVNRLVTALAAGSRNSDPRQEFLALLHHELLALFPAQPRRPLADGGKNVLLLVGVNGSGKTTSAAKLAHYFQKRGQRVLMAAADTFRAAGSTQLALWGEKLGIPVIGGDRGADPGSVVFNAMQSWQSRDLDLLIIDTAGRMQTKANLMLELEKLTRIIAKIAPGQPAETWLVLDASTGQNALVQAEKFQEFSGINGMVLAKLDGTAKGGTVVSIAARDEAAGAVRRARGNGRRFVGVFRERIRGLPAGQMKTKTALTDSQKTNDLKFMKIALKLSRQGLGRTEPNPMVGAVVVKDGRILASGYHRNFGAPHAETMALEHLAVPGATLYLTLEPCSHFGKTPPCVDLIIAKKVKRVVVAMIDPNPLVNGSGLRKLRAHGIETRLGVCRGQAERLNRHYLKAIRTRVPYVTLHAGISLDGKLNDNAGHSRWVTSEEGRRYSHSLRGEFSAILAGRGNIQADNPLLTLREPGWEGKTLYRVVLDSENSLSRRLNVFQEQERFPLVIFSSCDAANKKKKVPLHFFVGHDTHGLLLADVLRELYKLGISSLLVEGGGQVLDSFIRERLFDEMAIFYSNKIIGGRNSVQIFASGVARLEDARELVDCHLSEFADGSILRGYRKCSPA